MNKYWKSIALIMVIVLGVGTFYIYKEFQASQFPEFTIHKQSGDQDAMDPVTIQGQFMDNVLFLSDTVKITQEGSTYNRDRSFINMYLDSGFDSGMLENLQKEHRNFMRGKYNDASFYEDEKLLVYADVDVDYTNVVSQQDYKFQISILNKDENKKTAFTTDIPNAKNLNYVYVEDVQVVGNELYLLTSNDIYEDEEDTMEIHTYQFDIDTNKLLKDETIVTASLEANISVDLGLLPEVDKKGNHEYAVFRHIKNKEYWSEDGREREENDDVISSELIAYDFASNESTTLELPKEIQDLTSMEMVFDGSVIYFMDESNGVLTVYVYDVETKKIESQFDTDIPEAKFVQDNNTEEAENISLDYVNKPLLQIKNDKLYILTGRSMNADVMVMDLKSGDLLYDGMIKLTDEYHSETMFDLVLYNLQVKE